MAAAALTSAPSSSSSLENLPLIALESISEFLDRRTLSAFSLVSKSCSAAATSKRFRCIRYVVKGRGKLSRDVARWNEILWIGTENRHRAACVRNVEIVGALPRLSSFLRIPAGVGVSEGTEEDVEEEEEATNDATLAPDALFEDGGDDTETIFDDASIPFWWSGCGPVGFDGSSPRLTGPEKEERNSAWSPLARFLDQLPALRDLTWTCTDQVPQCVLSTLHRLETNRNLRLHVPTFSLRSLYQPKDGLRAIDPDEFALATSPCLYSVASPVYIYDTDGHVNFNEEGILDMVSNAAPNLASVSVSRQHPGDSIGFREAIQTPRPPWKGFFPTSCRVSGKPTRSLRRLMIGGVIFTQIDLLTWRRHTDFGILRSLQIRTGTTIQVLQTLAETAERGDLRSLSVLALAVPPLSNVQEHEHLEPTARLLRALGPLRQLELERSITQATFDAILDSQGEALRKLALRTDDFEEHRLSLTRDDLEALRLRCPWLQDLEIPLFRSRGDAREVQLYAVLGTFPRLEQLVLGMECSKRARTGSDDGEEEDDKGNFSKKLTHIRASLMNAAIDSSLAEAVFHTILSSSGARNTITSTTTPSLTSDDYDSTAPTSTNLSYLKIQVSDPEYQDESGARDQDLSDILRWIARSWVCKRELNFLGYHDDGHGSPPRWGHTITTAEMGKQERLALREWFEEDLEAYPDGGLYARAWKSLWPGGDGGDGEQMWWDGWVSLPLAVLGDKEQEADAGRPMV